MISCKDGFRPFCFYIEVVEQTKNEDNESITIKRKCQQERQHVHGALRDSPSTWEEWCGDGNHAVGQQARPWLLKKIHADGNPDYPEREEWQGMNFIR